MTPSRSGHEVTGTFIALEGAKGVGKTSVCELLAEHALARDVVVTKEPTGRFDLSNEARLHGIDLAAAIAADRREHVAEVIAPALRSGRAVVCDRYILSSLVFHTVDGVSAADIWHLNDGFPLPRFNLILSAPARVLLTRRRRRPTTRMQDALSPVAETSLYSDFANEMCRSHHVTKVEAGSVTAEDLGKVAGLIIELLWEAAPT